MLFIAIGVQAKKGKMSIDYKEAITAPEDFAGLPPYATALYAYHQAFKKELIKIVSDSRIPACSVVLDLACGDGGYLNILVESNADIRVTGIDINDSFVSLAKFNCRFNNRIRVLKGDVGVLPLGNESVDFVWCAQSFYSLPDPALALREVRRVLKKGGRIAILENDIPNHVLIPWPLKLETAFRQAEYEASGEETNGTKRSYVARNLPGICRESGLIPLSIKTYAHNRWYPFTDDEELFFRLYFTSLKERVQPFLSSRLLDQLSELIDPHSDSYLLHLQDSVITCLDHVVMAEKC